MKLCYWCQDHKKQAALRHYCDCEHPSRDFQPGEGTGLLRDCESSNFMKVNLQL